MSNVKPIKDDKYEVVRNDIEKLQATPSQFIGALGSTGSMHLAKEVINNAIDECISPKAMGKKIKVHLDVKSGTLTTSDNSRGIPSDILLDVFTVLTSSTKLRRQSGSASLGQNGTGSKAMVALSESVSIISERIDKKYKIDFRRGRLQGKMKEAECNGNHGLTVKFAPSPLFMGKDCNIIPEDLIEWIDKIHYMLPTDIELTLVIVYDDKDKVFKKVYKNKSGMLDYINTKADDKKSTTKNLVSNSMKMNEVLTLVNIDPDTGKEIVEDIVEERFIGIEYAFCFEEGADVDKQESFCNFCHTTEGGVHMDAVKSGMVTYFIDETNKTVTSRDSKDLKITPKDVLTGLVLGVYLSTNYSPMFVAQIKNKVGNGALHAPIRKLTLDSLRKYFNENPNKLKEATTFIKTNAKARLAGSKARKAVIKETGDKLAGLRNKNLIPANDMRRGKYREMFITEGGSAGNENARWDQDSQSLFLLKGFFTNTFNKDAAKVLENAEAKNLVKAMGCNIGPRFNMDKLNYDKIIILTDSDSDGYGISNLIAAFYLYHFPEIVKAGKLYKAIAPLYELKSGSKKFIRDRMEYVEEFRKRISDNIILTNPNTGKKLSKGEMEKFLNINKDYLEELMKTEAHYSIHRDIVDFLIRNIDDKKIGKKLTKHFPELSIDKEVLVGIYDGQYQRLIVDDLFINKISYLIKMVKANTCTEYETIITKGGQQINKGVLSLGKIMEYADTFRPPIATRFKGLGELDTEDLRNTTFNPNNRKLLRLTVKDIERELERFNVLHGSANAERKELYTAIEIDKDLLDN